MSVTWAHCGTGRFHPPPDLGLEAGKTLGRGGRFGGPSPHFTGSGTLGGRGLQPERLPVGLRAPRPRGEAHPGAQPARPPPSRVGRTGKEGAKPRAPPPTREEEAREREGKGREEGLRQTGRRGPRHPPRLLQAQEGTSPVIFPGAQVLGPSPLGPLPAWEPCPRLPSPPIPGTFKTSPPGTNPLPLQGASRWPAGPCNLPEPGAPQGPLLTLASQRPSGRSPRGGGTRRSPLRCQGPGWRLHLRTSTPVHSDLPAA